MDSLWLDLKKQETYSLLSTNKNTDICIIGAGIFGLTCAYYLTKLGFKVIVIEKDEVGKKTTGHTTGKITSQHGLFYNYLINSYGNKFAHDYLEVNEKAIENIKEIIDTEKINCDFEFQNSYVYTTKNTDIKSIKKEVESVLNLGFPCEFVTKTGLPFEISGAICFKKQAQFHPIKYLEGLCKSILSNGGKIYTNTTAINIEGNDNLGYLVSTNRTIVKSKFVIVASSYPFINFPGFYFTKMYKSTSYIIGVDTKKTLFKGMYISSSSPIFSYRSVKYEGKKLLLIGGSDHKTGKPYSYKDTYGVLEQEAKRLYPDCEILYRWNTQDCISLDKLPFIGSYSPSMSNVFVGTGFKKWGMTLSNVASNIIVDKICNKENKYEYLFKPSRLKPIKNRDELKNMIVQSTNSLLIDKLKPNNIHFDEIKEDSGSIIEINHEKVGVYKSLDGRIYAIKPICTHLGCLLSWNDIDKTWDCPCHGSRFDYKGKNLYDPAFKSLDSYDF